RAPAPAAAGRGQGPVRRQTDRAREVRRGRRHLHRRSLLHPPVGLPHPHRQGQPGSAAPRPGGHRDRRLRGLRPVRRERARGRAVPLLLPSGSRPEPEFPGQDAAENPEPLRMSLPERPVTILIAALGGEGGGVMADWLIDAAAQCGFPAQSTSIPGVAQRTGATTYYLEIFPAKESDLNGRSPVLSLTPSPGNVDI